MKNVTTKLMDRCRNRGLTLHHRPARLCRGKVDIADGLFGIELHSNGVGIRQLAWTKAPRRNRNHRYTRRSLIAGCDYQKRDPDGVRSSCANASVAVTRTNAIFGL